MDIRIYRCDVGKWVIGDIIIPFSAESTLYLNSFRERVYHSPLCDTQVCQHKYVRFISAYANIQSGIETASEKVVLSQRVVNLWVRIYQSSFLQLIHTLLGAEHFIVRNTQVANQISYSIRHIEEYADMLAVL